MWRVLLSLLMVLNSVDPRETVSTSLSMPDQCEEDPSPFRQLVKIIVGSINVSLDDPQAIYKIVNIQVNANKGDISILKHFLDRKCSGNKQEEDSVRAVMEKIISFESEEFKSWLKENLISFQIGFIICFVGWFFTCYLGRSVRRWVSFLATFILSLSLITAVLEEYQIELVKKIGKINKLKDFDPSAIPNYWEQLYDRFFRFNELTRQEEYAHMSNPFFAVNYIQVCSRVIFDIWGEFILSFFKVANKGYHIVFYGIPFYHGIGVLGIFFFLLIILTVEIQVGLNGIHLRPVVVLWFLNQLRDVTLDEPPAQEEQRPQIGQQRNQAIPRHEARRIAAQPTGQITENEEENRFTEN